VRGVALARFSLSIAQEAFLFHRDRCFFNIYFRIRVKCRSTWRRQGQPASNCRYVTPWALQATVATRSRDTRDSRIEITFVEYYEVGVPVTLATLLAGWLILTCVPI